MPFPAECPICKTVLEFPDTRRSDPVCCPVCDSRFILEGLKATKLAFTDYYKLLEVAPSAADDEIRKAIRAKVFECHPDRNPDDPGANEKLREIVQAREILNDSSKRRTYDEVHNAPFLSVWNKTGKKTRSRRPEPGPDTGARSRSEYEEMVENTRAKSRRTTHQDIDHLIREVEEILSGSSYEKNRKYFRKGYERVIQSELRNKIVGATAGLIVGIFLGFYVKAIGTGFFLILIFSTIAGWSLGSFSSELFALGFFLARTLIAGALIGLLAAKLSTGEAAFGQIFTILRIPIVYSLVGGALLGSFSLGAGMFEGRHNRKARIVIQGGTGAWLGAVIGFGSIMLIKYPEPPLVHAVLWWLTFFTVWLFIDYQLFGRPKIFIYM
ncbi:MAG: DnaJ domain-containing protein [bacterium]